MSPSKLVDYIATGKPILNFHAGEISSLLATWPYSLNLHVAADNTKEIVDFIERNRTLVPKGEIARHLAAHDVCAIARRVLTLAARAG